MKLLKLRRGPVAHMPHLSEAEIVYASDTNELYIGTAENNTTPNFNGGDLTDTTKGRFIPRHGTIYDIGEIAPGELFYLEDVGSLAVGLQDNRYIILNQEHTQMIQDLVESKRDKNVDIASEDIKLSSITLSHLTPDLRLAISGVEDPLEIVLAPGSVEKEMLAESARQIHDYGGFLR